MRVSISQYRFILYLLIPLALLLGVRYISGNNFRNGAAKNSLPAFNGTNMIDSGSVAKGDIRTLLINLDNNEGLPYQHIETIYVNPEDILSKQNIRLFKKFDGRLILVSDDMALSSMAWMLLSQMGIRDIFILGDRAETGSFNYEFRPDTHAVLQ